MKNIAILGSTGSIGRSALDVIRNSPREFRAAALSTNSDIESLYRQIKEFRPERVCVRDISLAQKLKPRLASGIRLFAGEEGLKELIRDRRIDKVLLAISGSAALAPLLTAIENNKEVALANKEALVMAGDIIMERAKAKKVRILPIDSEQSAIWQCLDHQDAKKLKNIYLTASGGPLRRAKPGRLKKISLKEVLRHPRWKMGRKITVDSATLMNKGLEVIEAMFLFKVSADKIKIVVHPEAIIHSMVEFIDGVILAQLSATDMRIPIQYALSYPKRLSSGLAGVDFCKLKKLNFHAPDFKKFPCLRLAYQAAREKGTMLAVLNAANEVCVDEFLNKKINFISIPRVIERVMSRHRGILSPSLNEIMSADNWARQEAYQVIKSRNP